MINHTHWSYKCDFIKSFKMTLDSEHSTKEVKTKDTETLKTKTQKHEKLVLWNKRWKIQTHINLYWTKSWPHTNDA